MTATLPEEFAVPTQRFTIYPFERNVLRGKRGTVITLEADALTFMDGIPITGKVEVELKEITNKRDIVLDNLTTISDSELLDSIYAVYINATCDDEHVDIQTNYPIKIELPANVKDQWEERQIYRGTHPDQKGRPWVKDKYSKFVYGSETAEKPNSGFGFFSKEKKAIFSATHPPVEISTSRLGWITCARILPVAKAGAVKGTLKITENTVADIFMVVVLENHGTCLPARREKNQFIITGIPLNEEINIVGIGIKDSTFYFAGRTTQMTDHQQEEELNFKSSTIPAIRKRLRALG